MVHILMRLVKLFQGIITEPSFGKKYFGYEKIYVHERKVNVNDIRKGALKHQIYF